MVIIGNKVRATKVFSSRAILGMLLGWALTFEGFFAFSMANSATIEGIGGIEASAFSLAAAQLITLGVFISVIWAFKGAVPGIEKKPWSKHLSLLTYLGMALVTLEGLVIVFIAGDVVITDFGGVPKKYVVLTGAQLFAIGALSLRLWRLRDVRPANWLIDTLGTIVASLLMVEGLTVAGNAGVTNIDGFGKVLEGAVYTAGVQLFLLGLLILVIWTIVYDPWIGPMVSKFLTERRSLLINAIVGGMVALEGVIAAFMTDYMVIEGIGGILKSTVVIGCSQLFALGLMIPLLWKVRLEKLDIDFLVRLVSPMAMVILATEGVVAIGLAAYTDIDGNGYILEGTFLLAGMQLLLLSLVGLTAYMIKDSPLLRTWPKRVITIIPIIPILTFGVIGLEGIAAAALSANILITDFGSVREQYILLAGVQMAIIAALALVSWARYEGISQRFKVTTTGLVAFLALMLPVAILI